MTCDRDSHIFLRGEIHYWLKVDFNTRAPLFNYNLFRSFNNIAAL